MSHCVEQAAYVLQLESQRQVKVQQLNALQAEIDMLDAQIDAAVIAWMQCEAEHGE